MANMKEWILSEPVIDCINHNQICTTQADILFINAYTVTKKELDFASVYNIKAKRDDYLHGFVVWFDAIFDSIHIPITLSTSPFYPATHWKQAIFMLDEALPVCKGDLITGSIASKKCAENPRHLDVKISVDLKGKAIKATAE